MTFFSTKNCSLQNAARPRAFRYDWLLVVALCALFYGITAHDDLLETSNHAWLLLDCLKNGQLRDYYNIVMEHQNALYYLNNAHYNILFYLLYAIWQLPIYLVCLLGHISVSEIFLMFWSKAVGVAAFGGCAALLVRIAQRLGYTQEDVHWVALFFVLNPIAFFSANVMSQYDTVCLLVLLAAVLAWLDGRLLRFALLAGVALVFKFFALLLFLPLLVLAEKRPLRCIGYMISSLWLYVPTALLFWGRTGDMSVFNDLVVQRIFAVALPGGADDLPIYLLLYACILFGCYLYRPRNAEAMAHLMPWLGVAVYGLLFVFINWHPQWLVLLIPFWVLSCFAQRQRAPWIYLTVILFMGYWISMSFHFPGQLDTALFRWGALGGAWSTWIGTGNTLSFYLSLIPYAQELASVAFAAPLLVCVLFQFPYRSISLGDRLSAHSNTPLAPAPSLRTLAFGSFALCIGIIWMGSALFVLAQAANIF
jgi:hypothetical protein